MATFDDVIDELVEVVENKNSRTEPFLRRSLADSLREVQATRALFMEATATFALVASQSDYDASTVDFPNNLLRVDALWFAGENVDGRPVLLQGPIPIREMRSVTRYPNIEGRPTHWAFHHEKLILWPTPVLAEDLTLEYQQDATRDSGTGLEITKDSTSATNAWLDRGRHVIVQWNLWNYHSTISLNADRAAMARQRYEDGIARLEAEYSLKSTASATPDWSFGE